MGADVEKPTSSTLLEGIICADTSVVFTKGKYLSSRNLQSRIPPQGTAPREVCAYTPRHMHECVHSGAVPNTQTEAHSNDHQQ